MHTHTNKRGEKRDSHLCKTEGTRLSTHLSISNIGEPLYSTLADVSCFYFSLYPCFYLFIYLSYCERDMRLLGVYVGCGIGVCEGKDKQN